MQLLAIETSCDETSVALVSREGQNFAIHSEVISSQAKIHEPYGGVVPELASRDHLENLPLLIDLAVREAGKTLKDIDGVVVTRGPGLKGCLLVGTAVAKGIALGRGIPLLGVSHTEGHILAPFMDCPDLQFPYLALLVSGGHTELVEVFGVGQYKVRARTSDDAAGEAFDKAAAQLELPYPGGPALAQLADSCSSTNFKLPKVMREAEGFSFSGLKTAIANLIRQQREALQSDPAVRGQLAKVIQDSIVDALVYKLKGALSAGGTRRVVLTGGVAANRALRAAVQSIPGVELFLPTPKHCTDNAAMIGYVGALRMARGERSEFTLDTVSRWPLEELR